MFNIYLVIGAFAGLMAGLFGIGGGIIVIPALTAMFLYHTMIPSAVVMQMVIGTSLAIMVVTSLSGIVVHQRHHAIMWPIVMAMLPGLVSGSVLGVLIARFLPSTFLRIFFAFFLVLIAIKLFFPRKQTESANKLSLPATRIGAVCIGTLSSLLGIGGGAMTVPFLLRCQLTMQQATGTSIACGLVIGIIASICFMLTGTVATNSTAWSTGYIYWPAFIGVAISSGVFAPLGAALAHRLPTTTLQRYFALFLLFMAIDMLFI